MRTHFASPQRSEPEELARQQAAVRRQTLLVSVLDAFPEPAMILNQNRQLVAANDKLLRLLEVAPRSLIGQRPGEVFHCIHGDQPPAGCGTTEFCKYCGAANAIVGCQQQAQAQVQECRISRSLDGLASALDLRVWATPLVIEGEMFTVFAVRDTTDEKRREVLERLFFHDALNSAGGLKTILDIWPELNADEVADMTSMAQTFAGELVEQIQAQRDLVSAERGDLRVSITGVDAAGLLADVCMLYSRHATTRIVRVAPPVLTGPTQIRSDAVLLRRVMGNLLKNAIEASSKGQTVTLTFDNRRQPVFSVHNQSAMPDSVRAQVFQRSFSTKEGKGRGVGCYSVKLLTETYLGGQVTFTSDEVAGTTFTVELPAHPATSS